LGSVDAVLEKHQKSRPWLSKMLSLLNLPEQAKRLVAESVSADIEVINTVKTIEKADPKAAKTLVDDLKATRGKANARDKAAAVKDMVKPSKKAKAEKLPREAAQGGTVATPKDRSQEEPGALSVFAGAKTTGDENAQAEAGHPVALAPAQLLNDAYDNIFELGSNPKTVIEVMSAEEKETVDAWLRSFYDAGVSVKDVSRTVIQGFRSGQFSSEAVGAFALAAFLQGVDSDAKYSLLNVLGSVKP
jgi:ParB family chromosome partitioning protein